MDIYYDVDVFSYPFVSCVLSSPYFIFFVIYEKMGKNIKLIIKR